MARRMVHALCLAVLVAALLAVPAFATAPGSNGRIGFSLGDPQHMWTVKPTGRGAHDLNAGSSDRFCGLSFSPDGKRVAYIDLSVSSPVLGDGSGTLFVANVDGTGARKISNARPAQNCGRTSWSPDSSRVAYSGWSVLSLAGGQSIMVVSADDPLANPRTVSDEQLSYFDAVWSPDGSRIASLADDGHVHVVAVADGSQMVSGDYGCAAEDWSPDGTRILEGCNSGQGLRGSGLWTVAAGDLGDPILLTDASRQGAFSPDGSQIALQLGVDPSNFINGIYTMPADGSGTPAQVTSGYIATDPVWQSLPRGR